MWVREIVRHLGDVMFQNNSNFFLFEMVLCPLHFCKNKTFLCFKLTEQRAFQNRSDTVNHLLHRKVFTIQIKQFVIQYSKHY